jgi:hypothetical protein
VKDPANQLRLGMPATVYVETDRETRRSEDKEKKTETGVR